MAINWQYSAKLLLAILQEVIAAATIEEAKAKAANGLDLVKRLNESEVAPCQK